MTKILCMTTRLWCRKNHRGSKRLVGPPPFDNILMWIEVIASIKKSGLNVVLRYCFGFVNIMIMLSQNNSIIRHPKEIGWFAHIGG